MALCGFWLFLLSSRFFLSDPSFGWNELRHQSQRSLPAGTSASATGSFRDRGDGDVGIDITELQEQWYRHSAEHSQLISVQTFCWKSRVVGSWRLFSETVCIFNFHTIETSVPSNTPFFVLEVSWFL